MRNPVFWRIVVLLSLLLWVGGCTRTRYRLHADEDVCRILGEETACTPWQPPSGFTVYPDRTSRFYLPTQPDDPLLPVPAPRLYAYRLPPLPEHDPQRFQSPTPPENATAAVAEVAEPRTHEIGGLLDPLIRKASLQEPAPVPEPLPTPEPLPASESPSSDAAPQPLPPDGTDAAAMPAPAEPQATDPAMAAGALPTIPEASAGSETPGTSGGAATALPVLPIPQSAWESIPKNCLDRMLEFPSVREEHDKTFGRTAEGMPPDSAPRLALEDIVSLSLVNSREYQTQKEQLYEAALQLSLDRYAYALKFASSGNGSDVDYLHQRAGGATANSLSATTTASLSKVLATGGDVLARFANDVVLTFNGPDGFTADIGSELLFEVSQSVFQRDIVFENLTQSERNVVYSARDYARYRKTFFSSLAVEYYQLLLTYREIEIAAQDYFSNVRGFDQGEAEYQRGRLPRFQVDQFEQDVFRSRSSLIAQCNALEQSLDALKIRMGLPPETPLNLQLTELDLLTVRDEMQVAQQRVRRARRYLQQAREDAEPDLGLVLNGCQGLVRRMLDVETFRTRLGMEAAQSAALLREQAELRVEEAHLHVQASRSVLDELIGGQTAQPGPNRSQIAPPPLQIYQRTSELVELLLEQVSRQIDLAALQTPQPEEAKPLADRLAALQARVADLDTRLRGVVRERTPQKIPQLAGEAEQAREAAEALAADADRLTGKLPAEPAEAIAAALRRADHLLSTSASALDEGAGGLVPVSMGADEAMITALVRRFDLMNQRGDLADTWRQIKLAGDDLRSVLNLNATQVIGTKPNRPMGFTLDESQTRLAVSFDAPLNRRSQRNAFRQSLINYQVAYRSLIDLEDDIKAGIRDDLRQLQLDREQYAIAVASAALAYERVVSTRLQLQLGVEDVAARDVLESQRDYTEALNSVAQAHIAYIVDRVQFFLDLEIMEVDSSGFWPELYDETRQPTPTLNFPAYAMPAYGRLPGNVWYSREVRRMLGVPAGKPGLPAPAPQ